MHGNMRISTFSMNHPNRMQKTRWFPALACLTAALLTTTPLLIAHAQEKNGAQKEGNPARSSPVQKLMLEQKQFAQGKLYALKVPKSSGYRVVPVLSKTLANIESPLWQNASGLKKPIFLINGGFFDPNNSLTTSFVFNKGMLTGDPRINPQLMNNPKLVPYLPKIFNRSEFRVYLCQKQQGVFETEYDIVPHNEPIPATCLLQDSLGAGPALLPKLEDFNEGFVDYNASGKITRDPVGVCSKNARSVVGLTKQGSFC
jgi:hypothetical protein